MAEKLACSYDLYSSRYRAASAADQQRMTVTLLTKGCFRELSERVFVVWNVHHCEQDTKVVFPLEISYPGVDVFRVEAVILETVVRGKPVSSLFAILAQVPRHVDTPIMMDTLGKERRS